MSTKNLDIVKRLQRYKFKSVRAINAYCRVCKKAVPLKPDSKESIYYSPGKEKK